MSELKKDPPVIHVKVTVTTAINPKTGEEEYIPKYKPEIIPVTESDTVLTFKLSDKTSDDIIISKVTPRPLENTQLSTPSISSNGKLVTLTDVNTAKETLHLTFEFGSKKPGAAKLATLHCADDVGGSDEYPEILNEPPP